MAHRANDIDAQNILKTVFNKRLLDPKNEDKIFDIDNDRGDGRRRFRSGCKADAF